MGPIFKDGAGTFDQALDSARRRAYAEAASRFSSAGSKLAREGRPNEAMLARCYADLFSLPSRNYAPEALSALGNQLRSLPPGTELKPGPRSISSEDLAQQLYLQAADTRLGLAHKAKSVATREVATALQQLASEFQKLGDQPLFLPELFQGRLFPANGRYFQLMASSFEILGQATQASDPLAAAEHFQVAQHYWSQAGEHARAEGTAGTVQALGMRARCWFCGREASGHGIQFSSLPIDSEVGGLKSHDTSPLPALDPSARNIYACRGCHSALHLLADRVATQRTQELEIRLRAEIAAVERRLRGQMR